MPLPTTVLIFGSVFVVSLISFVGILTIFFNKKLDKILNYLISFAAGAMLGAAFFDLLPESIGKLSASTSLTLALAGMIAFFAIESFLHWHHHHTHGQHKPAHIHPMGWLNLIADGVHNFTDGAIIAVSYAVSFHLGIITTIAVILHEIPQEFGDFGVLIRSGFSKFRALFFNFLSALTAIAGAFVSLTFSGHIPWFNTYMVPFAAGGFIYIAATDLLPELHHETKDIREAAIMFVLLLVGVLVIWLAGTIFGAG